MSRTVKGRKHAPNAGAFNRWKCVSLMSAVWGLAIVFCVGTVFAPTAMADEALPTGAEAAETTESVVSAAGGTLDEGQMLFLERLAEKRFASRWTELTPEQLGQLRRRADAYETVIREQHTPFGLVVSLRHGGAGGSQSVTFEAVEESILWTGYYLAAQSYRFAVQRDSGAVMELRRVLSALETAIEVSGRSGFVPVFCAPANHPGLPEHLRLSAGTDTRKEPVPVYRGIAPYSDWIWIGTTSRDTYEGLNFGLATTHRLVRDVQVRNSVSNIIDKVLGRLESDNWRINNGRGEITFVPPLLKAGLLRTGATLQPARFQAAYKDAVRDVQEENDIPAVRYGEYRRVVLKSASYFAMRFLETEQTTQLLYQDRLTRLWRRNSEHVNPLIAALYLNAFQTPPRDLTARAVLQGCLYLWPSPPRRATPVDWTETPGLSRIEANGQTWAENALPVRDRPPAPFQWAQSPFLLQGGAGEDVSHPGIDFMLPFWMGRDSGIIANEEVAAAEREAAASRESSLPGRPRNRRTTDNP